MAETDKMIAEIVNKLYKAGVAGWGIQDKAALLAAVQQSLMPVAANFPKKEGQEPGKDQE